MKLLLTSNGISNKSIKKALLDLNGKSFSETNLVFIPTAANAESGDKQWLINDLENFRKLGFNSIEITDISIAPESIWKQSLEQADIIVFGGGNTHALWQSIQQIGLNKILPKLLKNKIYVGISAGSIITNPKLLPKTSTTVYKEITDKKIELESFSFVDFYFFPHLNSEHFPLVRENKIKEKFQNFPHKIFAIDDQSALKITNGKIEVISEGDWIEIN